MTNKNLRKTKKRQRLKEDLLSDMNLRMAHSPYDAEGAKKYDQLRRWKGSPVLQRVVEIAGLTTDKRVLDVGCGTGHLGGGLHALCNSVFVGIDRSIDMLQRAASKQVYEQLLQSDATSLPFVDGAFKGIVGSFFLHHISPSLRPLAIKESYRTLVQGCAIFITAAHEDIFHSPLGRFFPDLVTIDTERFPRVESMRSWLSNAGFVRVGTERVQDEPVALDEVYADRVERKHLSTLEMIDPERFRLGMQKLREHVHSTKNHPETFRYASTLVFGFKR